MIELFLNALDISSKSAMLLIGVFYFFDRKSIASRVKVLEDCKIEKVGFEDFKTETERQLDALWKKLDFKLDTEIPNYFREIKEMWHNNDKSITCQKIEFDNLNKKVDELAKRQDTLISNTLETLAILVKRGKHG